MATISRGFHFEHDDLYAPINYQSYNPAVVNYEPYNTVNLHGDRNSTAELWLTTWSTGSGSLSLWDCNNGQWIGIWKRGSSSSTATSNLSFSGRNINICFSIGYRNQKYVLGISQNGKTRYLTIMVQNRAPAQPTRKYPVSASGSITYRNYPYFSFLPGASYYDGGQTIYIGLSQGSLNTINYCFSNPIIGTMTYNWSDLITQDHDGTVGSQPTPIIMYFPASSINFYNYPNATSPDMYYGLPTNTTLYLSAMSMASTDAYTIDDYYKQKVDYNKTAYQRASNTHYYYCDYNYCAPASTATSNAPDRWAASYYCIEGYNLYGYGTAPGTESNQDVLMKPVAAYLGMANSSSNYFSSFINVSFKYLNFPTLPTAGTKIKSSDWNNIILSPANAAFEWDGLGAVAGASQYDKIYKATFNSINSIIGYTVPVSNNSYIATDTTYQNAWNSSYQSSVRKISISDLNYLKGLLT